MTGRRTTLGLLAAIFLLALLPRLPSLGSYLTPDERLWSMRTAQFLQALQSGNWSETLTSGHPGVTVTWAGSLGVGLKWLLAPPAGAGASLAELTAALAADPNRLDMIPWLRLPIVVTTALGVALIFLLARRLLPHPAAPKAAVAAALLAVDPFFLAHSRVLQMDALLATFVAVAWLALLVATKTGRRRWFVLSGAASGLGVLTKSPALILGPIMLAWVLASRWRGQANRPAAILKTSLVDLLWIGLPAALTMFLLWPALWVSPLATLRRLWEFSLALGGTGHELSNYWLGQVTAAPGALFYPAVLLWRTTPVTLIGLILAVVFVLARWRRPDTGNRPPVGPLLLFVLWFGLIMSLGDKKFDRYLLPVFPALALLAAWGWGRILNSEFGIQNSESRILNPEFVIRNSKLGFALILVGIQLWCALANLPSYLTAYNPLVGGIGTARRVMLVGWGEGLEEAAAFLNQQPEAGKRRAAAWYGQNVFGPFFQGRSYDLFYDLPTAADLYAHDVDFVVTYINQLQRDLLDESIGNRLNDPIMSSSKGNVPLAQVYRWPKPFAHTTEQALAPGLRLLGWSVEPPQAGRLPVRLYWDAGEALAASQELPPASAWIKDGAGEVWASAEGRVVAPPGEQAEGWLGRPVIAQSLELALPPGLLAGSYRIEAAPLGGTILALDEVDLAATAWTGDGDLAVQPLADDVRFGDSARLLGYELVVAGPEMMLDLLWAALSAPPPGASYFVHVVEPAGEETIAAQQDGVLAALPGRPASWQAGELARQRIRLPLPEAIASRLAASDQSGPRGEVQVYVGLYDTQSGRRLPLTVNGAPAAGGRYLLLALP